MIALRKPQSARDWIAFFIGAVVAYFSGMQLLLGLWSLGWTKTAGVITYSQPYRAFRTYWVGLRYKYNYHGHEFTGDVYRFMFVISVHRIRSWQVDSVQARYRVGEPIELAVNPWNPSEAVLEPGVDADSFMWPAIGLLIMLAGLFPSRKEQQSQAKSTVPGAVHATAHLVGDTHARPETKPRYRLAKTLFVIGNLVLLWGLSTLYTGWTSSYWPTADGKIFYSTARNTGNNYRVQLWYEYNVHGARYVAEDYRVGGNVTPFREVARAAAKRYPVGQSVKVYYNPANPSEAVLEPGLWYGNFIFAGLGLFILGIALLAKKYSDAVAKIDARKAQKTQIGVTG